MYKRKEIEEMSIDMVKRQMRKTGKGKLSSFIAENDKEPSWDGHIYAYWDRNCKKEQLMARVPVQVKGTEVREFSKKYNSFSMELSDLNNYFNDQGVIFFVVEIKNDDEYKIFYKVLLPVDIRIILDEAIKKGNQKTINVDIDCVWTNEVNFWKVCRQFKIHRDYQGIGQVKNSLALDDIKSDKIRFLSPDINDEAFFESLHYPYLIDDHNNLLPIKTVLKAVEIISKTNNKLVINGKEYFDSFEIHKRNDGSIFYSFGDYVVCEDTTYTLKESRGTILERMKTIEFFLDILDEKNNEDKVKQMLSTCLKEKKSINKIINISKKFNIDIEKMYLSKMTSDDFYFLNLLSKINNKSGEIINGENKLEFKLIPVNGENVLTLKATSENGVRYFDYYSEDINIVMYIDKKYKVSRFTGLNKEAILCCNFNKELVKRSISEASYNDKKVVSVYYNDFALEFIKAWDIVNNYEYLELAEYILDYFQSDLDYIYKINKKTT